MAIGTIISTLSKLLGGPQFPIPGESKFQYEDTRYRGTLTASGLFVAETTSAFLEQTGHFGDVYFLPNPLNLKSVKPPFLIGTPGSFITAWGGIFTTEVSSLKGVNALSGTNTLTGTTFLNGQVTLNGKDLEAELALGKSLPPSSDEQLKENISTIQNPIDKVNALRGVDFNWKENGKKQIGVIAQEVEKILPELVEMRPDGYKGVHYDNIIGLLIESIKEQQKQINELKEKIDA
jgi:hypothetical protein